MVVVGTILAVAIGISIGVGMAEKEYDEESD